MSLTSDEVNYLVFRYLVESGFIHTSFAFQQESAIHKSDVKGSSVKPGALINVIQKGLQYMEIEAHLNQDGTERKCSAPFSLTGKHECEYIEEEEESKISRNRKEMTTNSKKARTKRSRKESGMSDIQLKDDPMLDIETEVSNKSTSEISIEPTTQPSLSASQSQQSDQSMQNTLSEDYLLLERHHEAVVCGASHPTNSSIFASGSTDCTVRIWTVPSSSKEEAFSIELKPVEDEIAAEITCLAWNQSGQLLAVGDRVGNLRIWTENGELIHIMKKHEKAISSLSWNKRGDVLVSTSEDCSAIAWDSSTGECRQQFEYHVEPICGISWQDNITFATCSHDKDVFVCQLGSPVPIKQCEGHQGKVTCISWDVRGEHLLSGSEDSDLKLWKLDAQESVATYKGHKSPITNLKWAPEGSEDYKIFASSSLDGTVRVWHIDSTSPIYILDTPTSFSSPMKKPLQYLDVCFLFNDSTIIAVASNQGTIYIGNRKTNSIIKTINRNSSDLAKVNQLSVNTDGNRLYGVASDKTADASPNGFFPLNYHSSLIATYGKK